MELFIQDLNIPTKRSSVLDGILFCHTNNPDTILIAINGIHGNFYSYPFYKNIGFTLNKGNIDFIYGQTSVAFGKIKRKNLKTEKEEIICSYNGDFNYTDEDIEAYIDLAKKIKKIYI